ncbi:MAG TPA: hypothetical protein VKX17_10795 [Planctomycetota bacterium]|nr:hypothetical protein [Planctomycetota bacterium]
MKYVLKVLLDLEARDDVAARQAVSALVREKLASVPGVREVVLHSAEDHKSIRVGADGAFEGQWNKGGHGKS